LPGALFFLNAPFLFGWAKPVPVNLNTVVRNGGYNGAIGVSLAGVAYNFALAFSAALVLMLVDESFIGRFLTLFFTYTVVYNVILGYFNLLPIPTLDGAHAVEYFALKNKMYSFAQKLQSMERYGMVFLVLFIATPLSRVAFIPAFDLINYLLS
jgi:Zn-dependent protease